MDRRAKPRWLQKLRANLGGYFWMPCPLCTGYFGGHEWSGTVWDTPNGGRGVCANCVEKAGLISVEKANDFQLDKIIDHVQMAFGLYEPTHGQPMRGTWINQEDLIDYLKSLKNYEMV